MLKNAIQITWRW